MPIPHAIFTPFFLAIASSSMEKRRPKESTDESAAVKAAAWAWYQHGSGLASDGAPAREDDAARPRHVPRPSRYKLEAMRSKDKEGLLLFDHNSKPQSNNNVSLLDAYEIQSISRHLDYLIDQYSSAYHDDDDDHKDNEDFRRKDAVSDVDDDQNMTTERKKKNDKNMKKVINLRGFWIRHAMAMCGTREDVVETAARGFWDGRQRRQTVVMAATCRPWSSVMHSRGR